MSKHTPEPWPHFVDVCYHATLHPESYGLAKLGFSDYHRAMKCVNACAGMEDPAEEIAELKRQSGELLAAMRQTLAMLRVTSHGPSAANKAEEMLHAAICSLGADHSPDTAKMVVPAGWQLVPVDPTTEMRLAGVAAQSEKLKRYALGGSLHPIDHGIPDAYKAMLAAAPKPEGGAA